MGQDLFIEILGQLHLYDLLPSNASELVLVVPHPCKELGFRVLEFPSTTRELYP